jgi:hypothetical protein
LTSLDFSFLSLLSHSSTGLPQHKWKPQLDVLQGRKWKKIMMKMKAMIPRTKGEGNKEDEEEQ